MRASLIKRVERLERRFKDRIRQDEDEKLPETPLEFLSNFEEIGRQGGFDNESDFPLALESFRNAIDPADPQTMPRQELTWVNTMIKRVMAGRPPVTLVEFEELSAWFAENHHRIPDGIELSNGRRVFTSTIRYRINDGPKSSDVTELVEMLRELRSVLG